MSLLFKVFLAHCRSNMYLIIGICLGLSLSLILMPIEVEDCQEGLETLPLSFNKDDFNDEYEPRFNVEEKPRQAQKIPKLLVRPRYYSTELGIREKLFVGIITSQEYLHSRGVTLNKTVAHLVDKIRYFISIPEGTKPNVSLSGIVGFTDTRSILKPFHVLKYITDNYLEDYDFYYLIKDTSYVNARKLIRLIDKISVSQNVYMGIPSEIETYCSLDGGILLSNSVIKALKRNLDWCVRNTYSDSDDINFGRCILHSVQIPCFSSIQGQTYSSYKLSSAFNFERNFKDISNNKDFRESMTVYPILDHKAIFKMNAYFSRIELSNVEDNIAKLRTEMLEMSNLEPPRQRTVSWPLGNQPGNKAPGRFDILRWSYFNSSHIFLHSELETTRELIGNAKTDIDRVVAVAIKKLENKYPNLKYKKLLNGYQKYDASRGMDYILDFSFADETTKKEHLKRVELCKPLGKVEILPVPYVTETSRVYLVMIVNLFNKDSIIEFLNQYAETCMKRRNKTFLMLALLYDPESASKGKEDIYYDVKQLALSLSAEYKRDQSKVTWLSIRLPTALKSSELEPSLQLAITDLSVKKFASESLILFIETNVVMDVKLFEPYLNRVRMNVINQWQIFSPIPFVEYNQDVAEERSLNELDVNRNHGRYDENNYVNLAFYAKDYTLMRKNVESKIPFVRSDKDINTTFRLTNASVFSIFDMFATYSDLHCFRAVEPTLRIRYKEKICSGINNQKFQQTCIKDRNYQLGHRGQLAKLVLDYQMTHS